MAEAVERRLDRRGGNRAKASVACEIHEHGRASQVRLYGSIRLSGALAQMGRGGIVQDVADRLTAHFSERLHGKRARTIVVAWIRRSVASLLGRAGQPQSAGSGGCRAAPS